MVFAALVAALGVLVPVGAWIFGGDDAPEPDTSPQVAPSESPRDGTGADAAAETEGGSPSLSALMDRQLVTLSVPVPSPRFGNPGVTLCRSDNDDVCTRLQHQVVASDDTTATVEVVVPRRFVTWLGEIHDCIDVSPCQLRIWTGTNNSQESGIPVSFNPEGPLGDPATALEPPVLRDGGETATLSFPGGPEGRAIQCARDRLLSCAAETMTFAVPDVNDPGLLAAEIAISQQILTPSGAYNCISDGICEVRFITSNGVFVEPYTLQFRPDVSSAVAARATVRPSTGLNDGQLVEIRVTDLLRPAFVAFLCTPSGQFCVGLDGATTVATQGTVTLRLPRFVPPFTNPTEQADPVDCAVDTCVVRISTGFSALDAAITFDPDGPVRPNAEVSIAPGTYRPGDTIRIRGRNFPTIKLTEGEPFRVHLCDNTTNGNCLPLEPEPRLMDTDGNIDTFVQLEESLDPMLFTGSRPLCGETCWLVVTSALAEAAIEVQLEPASR